ncbi:hypothetical protein COLO4_06112 [Corchorus olitorius]|uniref:Uncharacterized protein n=1 Tax=Corchorus olitorius TaxID=93759 RepID=A0A1R3KP00_9ROSI|nr:hypothetical protein COLO4_06112 [Corchorus olitorius]
MAESAAWMPILRASTETEKRVNAMKQKRAKFKD